MIADKAPELLEASKSMYEYNADTDMRQRCIARMEYINDMKRIEELSDEVSQIKEQWSNEKEQWSNEKEQLTSEKELLAEKLHQLEKILLDNGITVE